MNTLKLIISLCIILSSVKLIAQENSDPAHSDQCKYIPQIEKLNMWKQDLKTKVQKDKITASGLGVYQDKLFMIDKNVRVPDIYFFDFETKDWVLSQDSTLFNGLELIYKDKFLPWGLAGIEIVNDTLFTIGIEKEPFTAISLVNDSIIYSPEFELPDYHGSEGPSGIAFSFPIVYLAFHSLDYDIEIEKTQRLYGVNCVNGNIIFDVELLISDNRGDFLHALTTLNNKVWHMKDSTLVQMDGKNGEILNVYELTDIGRTSSICFFNNSLWISTYEGGLYELPLECIEK